MKVKILFLVFLLTIISCVEKQKSNSEIIVDLNISTIDNPFRKSMSPLRYMDSIQSEFKGIINRDSSFVLYLNTVNSRDLKKSIKEGKLKQETVDSVKTKIYALSGYNKGKQFYVLDLNGNKDFGDEEIVEFDKNIYKKENYRDSFAIKKIKVVKFGQDKFYKQTSYLQFLPVPTYFTYKDETQNEKFKHGLQLSVLKHDYSLGKFKIGATTYGVGAKKGWDGYEFIFKEFDTVFYSRNHQLFSKYLLKDTVKLDDKYFTIDSLSTYPPKFALHEITIEDKLYGFRTNEISKNYQITGLNNNVTTLKDLAKEKDYLLLDFWGTWCAPCKELTPELVQLHKKYKDKIQFASLAFEMNPKPVLEYVKENNMQWYNGIIKGKPKSGDLSSPIIGGLRIECYPTFIVLDSDLNILFRTCGGGDNFFNLKTFLSLNL